MGTSNSVASRRACLFVALLITLLLFGDVLFRRASIAPIDYAEPLQNAALAPIAHSFLPERPGRQTNAGQGDTGSGAFQFEPAQGFMAYCLRHGESPFWDPYTATGALGPETSAELKFSPVTLITALLGGSSRSLCFVLVASYLVAAYSLLRACTFYLGLSLAAGTVAAAVYFLNGFALSNLYNPIGQPYFLAPLLLLSMLAVTAAFTPRNAFAALAAHVLFLATTFFPVTVLCLIVVYGFTLSLRISEGPVRTWRILAVHVVVPLTAVLLLAFLYLPMFDAMKTDLDMVGQYNTRATPGLNVVNLLSFFTPKHYWESYHAFYRGVKISDDYYAWVHHLGIIGPFIAAHAFSRYSKAPRPVLVTLGVCVAAAAGQIWGLFPFTLIDRLPFFSFVRNEYWTAMVVLALVLLCAYGYDAITETNAFGVPSWILLAVMVGAFSFTSLRSDLPLGVWARQYVVIFWVILMASVTILVAARMPRITPWSRRLLLFALLAEGMFYMNTLRPYRSNRDQRIAPAILWVKSQIQSHPGARLLNIGRSGVFPNWGSALQIPQLGNLNTASFPWYRNFFYAHIGNGLFLSLGGDNDTYTFTDESLSLAGVRYIMVDRTYAHAIQRLTSLGYPIVHSDTIRLIYENSHVLPRSFMAGSLVRGDLLPSEAGSSPNTVATSTDETLISNAAALHVGTPAVQSSSQNWSAVEDYHHARIRVHCKLGQPGLLMLMDSWSPRWKASVDGKNAYIGRADITFRAVALPAGEHEVVFWYQPLSLVVGESVSAAVFVALCFIFWRWTKTNYDTTAPQGKVQYHAA